VRALCDVRFVLMLVACGWSPMLTAHPAEQALVMLLPTGFYTAAGTVAVGLTLLLITLLRAEHLAALLRGWPVLPVPSLYYLPLITSVISTVCLLLLIAVGFAGPDDPQNNLLPLTIWTAWWVGVFVIQGIGFDIWYWINPWTGVARCLLGNQQPVANLPERLGAWPAVLIFLVFQYFLIVDIAPADPDRLATLVLTYWLLTLAGIAVFGASVWLERVECFSVVFQLIGSQRLLQRANGKVLAGLPGWGSVGLAPLSLSLSVLSLMVLISGSFDGFRETFWWLGLIDVNPLEFPGRSAVVLSSTVGLVAANVGVIAVYALSLWIGLWAVRLAGGKSTITLYQAFNVFAVSIIPIALGYHFAHYFVSFLVQIQVLVATWADPLAQGWNLFGLASFRVTTGFLNSITTVKPILLTNVFVVVLSHMIAVVLAHRLAGTLYATRRDVVLVQVGLSIFMLFYTLFGLWLLSTPRGA